MLALRFVILPLAFAVVFHSWSYGQPVVFPKADWEETPPEAQGVHSKRLNDTMTYLGKQAGGEGVSRALVVRNGYLIWKGPDIDVMQPVWSCTKSFTSTVLGLLIDDGRCTLDTLAVEHRPDLDDQHLAYGQIKFRHFASMTSGYDGQKGVRSAERRWGNPLEYLKPAAPLFPPGTAYKYHDPALHQFGYILTQLAEEPLMELFKRRIAVPIGMRHWKWGDYGIVDGILLNNPSGIYGQGMQTTARDMARFGHLFLNRGNWDGKQLVSRAWVGQATTNQVPASFRALSGAGSGVYGLLWWVNGVKPDGKRKWPSAPVRTFAARGNYQCFCLVIPEWNMVVVRLSVSQQMRRGDEILDRFFAGLREALLDGHGENGK